MELLLHSVDVVIRSVMPVMLNAAGLESEAVELKQMDPIVCKKSLIASCRTLNRLCDTKGMDKFWEQTIKDAKFWCEAAVWAAAGNDELSLLEYVGRLMAVVQSGAPEVQMH